MKNKTKRREASVFNLAFLDIMSCGLGAVVLIFLLIKHNTDISTTEDSIIARDTSQIITLNNELKNEIKGITKNLVSEVKSLNNSKKILEKLNSDLKDKEDYLTELKKEIKKSKEIIDLNKKEIFNSLIQVKGKGQRNYLVGMNVEGKRIAIILDSSASMSDELLVNILRRNKKSNKIKAEGDKWQKAIRISSWLLSRLPSNSEFQFFSFNNKFENHSINKTWSDSRDQSSINYTIKSLMNIFPDKGSNLALIFKELSKVSPRPTDIYLITDGLPTLGPRGKLFSRSMVSPGERVEFYRDAYYVVSRSTLSDTKINIILLPMEGDIGAGENYWELTNYTNGTLMSPSKDWP
ncbi:hypothetical protein OAN34_04980 [Hyphomicrobiales bacterium]|nr:hypothetical protein [Hyphomicrobiales bacterium]